MQEIATLNNGHAVPTVQRPHLSPSQLGMLLNCPRQWQARYVDGVTGPTSPEQAQSSALHAALKSAYEWVITGEKDDIETSHFFRGELTEEYYSQFAALDSSVSLWHDDGVPSGEWRDQGCAALLTYWKEIGQHVRPALMEHEVRVPIPGTGWDLLGYIDLIEQNSDITDYKMVSTYKETARCEGCGKSVGKNGLQQMADESLQLDLYDWARWKETGEIPKVKLHVLLKDKQHPRVQIVEGRERTVGLLEFREHQMREAVKLIESGGPFLPRDGWWGCSSDWCDAWSVCKGGWLHE